MAVSKGTPPKNKGQSNTPSKVGNVISAKSPPYPHPKGSKTSWVDEVVLNGPIAAAFGAIKITASNGDSLIPTPCSVGWIHSYTAHKQVTYTIRVGDTVIQCGTSFPQTVTGYNVTYLTINPTFRIVSINFTI